MNRPLLQIALDQVDKNEALIAASIAQEFVDIIEVGTILAFSQGVSIVRELKAMYPNHILVCDLKTTDGGAILANMAFQAGADWLTVSAAAHIATIEACKKVADKFNREIQIEIYGNWTFDDVKQWRILGIKQCIYHRSRDAELAGVGWTPEDITKMRRLSDLGMEVSITGGIVASDIHLFKEINAKCFIAGRALSDQGAKETALQMKDKIKEYWP